MGLIKEYIDVEKALIQKDYDDIKRIWNDD